MLESGDTVCLDNIVYNEQFNNFKQIQLSYVKWSVDPAKAIRRNNLANIISRFVVELMFKAKSAIIFLFSKNLWNHINKW